GVDAGRHALRIADAEPRPRDPGGGGKDRTNVDLRRGGRESRKRRGKSMKVPYQLRWLPQSAAATALLVPGHRADEVLRVCAELGADPLPAVYAVADGYLLLLATPSQKQIVGATRLRGIEGVPKQSLGARSLETTGLGTRLLIPVNAELIPALLPDESEALVRKRGLVFLPGARVLEFNPEQPIALSALLRV